MRKLNGPVAPLYPSRVMNSSSPGCTSKICTVESVPEPPSSSQVALDGNLSFGYGKFGSYEDPIQTADLDVDNTLMRGASLYYFARGLAARKLFTTRDLIRFGWGQLVFRFSGAEQRHHINEACETALAFVAGRKVSDLVALCEEI